MMSLTPGARFGPYEVTALIGVGGMGEVYRALDTSLRREVALKILPDVFVDDANRLARLQREAELLAALNHPNIAHVYGLERSGGVTALVMELVEGSSLAARIGEGPIPVPEALALAEQLVAALEAAHERGIVHRDLKPDNIRLGAGDTLKVLDFGIAKALDPKAMSGPRAPALTTPAMTEAGVMLGTAAYMSPEQARGKPVDQRADIWAFGCVLYEMLAAKPAFLADDVTTTLARVLERDADMSRLPAAVPPAVRRTLELCLQKDPRKRIADVRDVQLGLDGAFATPPPTARGADAQPRSWRRALPAAGGLAAGVAIAALALFYPAEPVERPVSRLAYRIPEEQAFPVTGRSVLALSPDGRLIAYSTERGLYIRPLDSLVARLVPGTQGGLAPFFSPDGKRIGYFGQGGRLEHTALSGGAPVTVAEWTGVPGGATWAPDGSILFADYSAGILRVRESGKAELAIPAEDGEQLYGPELLPDGDTVVFSSMPAGDLNSVRVAAQSLSSGRRVTLVQNGGDAHVLEGGYLTYSFRGELFAARFDARTLKIASDPVSAGVQLVGTGISPASNYGVARNGTLAYLNGSSILATRPVWMDRDGREEVLEGCPCVQGSISPDGTRIVFTSPLGEERDAGAGIVVWSIGEQMRRRITFEPGLQYAPLWSPDGERIAYGSPQGIFWRRADGAGSAEPLLLGSALVPSSWTPDGRLIFGEGGPGVGSGAIGLLTLGAEPKRESLIATQFEEGRAAISPDGRWLAYQSNESGRYEIYVRPFPNVEGGKWAISAGGGEDPRWSRDGRTLYFTSAQRLMSADVSSEPTFSSRPAQKVVDLNGLTRTGIPFPFDVSPDGRRFLFNKSAANVDDIIVVQNWTEELEGVLSPR